MLGVAEAAVTACIFSLMASPALKFFVISTVFAFLEACSPSGSDCF